MGEATEGGALGEFAGRYRLDAVIGRGATGVVYLAHDRTLERPVAIKALAPGLMHDATSVARFSREARCAAALHHPNAIAVYDVGEEEGRPYFVMEYISGGTLADYLAPNLPAFSVDRVMSIGAQIAEVLDVASEIPIIHRDLKPGNVFLRQGNQVKVSDFGLAFVLESEDPSTGRLTTQPTIASTPEYMSPEQASATEDLSPASDVYSLGCILYEMLAGAPPFTGTLTEVLASQMHLSPPALAVRCPEAPADLVEMIMRMLAKRPLDRPCALDVVGALAGMDAHGWRATAGAEAEAEAEAMRSTVSSLRVAVWRDGESIDANALSELGIIAVPASDVADLAGLAAVLCLGTSVREIEQLTEQGVPVVADCRPDDAIRAAALLRTDVAAIVDTPDSPEALARALWRTARSES